MADIRTWESNIKRKISELNPNIDVEFGPVYDLLVRPMAQIFSDMDNRIDYVEKLTDITRWVEFDDEDVDLLASNYGLKRRDGTHAVCVVTFYSVRKPAGKVIIPEGFVVMTEQGTKFVTIERKEIVVDVVDNYRNSETGRYEFDVRVRALVSGMEGNVASGTIIRMSQALPYISGVMNKVSAMGGHGVETNRELVERIKDVVKGSYGSATLAGLRYSLITNFEDVSDGYVEKVKPVIEGSVDVFYKGVDVGLASETTYWYGFGFTLKNRPVIDVLSVRRGNTVYVKGVDWRFVKDVVSAYRGTVNAYDKIEWLDSSTNRPSYGDELTVEYVYNRLGGRISEWAKLDENRFIEPVVWYREAVAVPVEIEVNVKLYKGYGSETIEKIREVIYDYVNALMLGEALEMADIMDVVYGRVKGIDNMVFVKLCEKGKGEVRDLEIEKSQYFTVLFDDVRVNLI